MDYGCKGHYVVNSQKCTPTSIAIDSKGRIFISFTSHQISVYSSKGEWECSFTYNSSNQVSPARPWIIAINSSDKIVVADHGKRLLLYGMNFKCIAEENLSFYLKAIAVDTYDSISDLKIIFNLQKCRRLFYLHSRYIRT